MHREGRLLSSYCRQMGSIRGYKREGRARALMSGALRKTPGWIGKLYRSIEQRAHASGPMEYGCRASPHREPHREIMSTPACSAPSTDMRVPSCQGPGHGHSPATLKLIQKELCWLGARLVRLELGMPSTGVAELASAMTRTLNAKFDHNRP